MSKASALCWGKERSLQAAGEKSPQIMADPDKFRDSRPLKGEVQPSQGSGVPSDLGYHANPSEGLQIPLEVSALPCAPHPTKILEHGPSPPCPKAGVPLRCVLLRGGAPHLGVGSGQLVGSLKHLHEEGVNGGVSNELEEKQML